ncbi:hypothetical protein GBSOP10_10228 [Armatimonadetes bacterium GBS]|jgi:hypothetical protein|nr:MAG: hypothetical protein KatS3mg021_1831 [Fimbriimonadales bacterium]CUU02805.1 hypothetical protein GBSOP10_10228 [Armatimonadetes bacterium GBS]CUU35382.1 hypothetical protein GXSOP10_1218 [Armatimonadetes bacterium GXS]
MNDIWRVMWLGRFTIGCSHAGLVGEWGLLRRDIAYPTLEEGTVELAIVLKYSNGHRDLKMRGILLWLEAENTRSELFMTQTTGAISLS